MNTKSWTTEEESLLRSLHLDPIRNNREKLTALVGHFQKGGGVWAVSEAGTGTVLVSRALARKVRDLSRDHKLDWLLATEDKADRPDAHIPRLSILLPSVDIWTDGPSIAKYATLEVAAVSKVEVKDCWAWVKVLPGGLSFPLHWAGTPYTAEDVSAPRIIINPAKSVRLDVAVALPPPGKVVGHFPNAKVSGEVAMFLPSSRYGGQTWSGEGCWLAQPLALYSPNPKLESYLPPGEYRINVCVGCEACDGDNREFILRSPILWEELALLLPT